MSNIKEFIKNIFSHKTSKTDKKTPAVENAKSSYTDQEIEEFINKYTTEDYTPISNAPDNAEQLVMDGIMLGDIIGSPYESDSNAPGFGGEHTTRLIRHNSKVTDDSLMSWAIKDALTEIKQKQDSISHKDMVEIYAKHMKLWAKWYPDAGFGGNFYNWAVLDMENPQYKSCGDGSAMRAGIIGAMCPTFKETMEQAVLSAMPTHSHPEGVKGAVVAAGMVWLALHGYDKDKLLEFASKHYPGGQRQPNEDAHWLDPTITEKELKALGPETQSIVCQMAVPEAVANIMHSDSYEGCIRKTLSYSCDADTVGAISGGVAAALYGNTDIQGYDVTELLEKSRSFLNGYYTQTTEVAKEDL